MIEFLHYFSERGIPSPLATEVYVYLKNFKGKKDFIVKPEDGLYKVYGMWNEDLDDAVLYLVKKCGGTPPTTEQVKDFAPVRTVKDLIALVFHLCKMN